MRNAHADTQRLALGTAQFGLDYGIAGGQRVPEQEVHEILSQARHAGMDTLDTAVAYGDSEACLGTIGVADWRVVTKLPGLPDDTPDVAGWVERTLSGSLQRLRIDKLHGLLLHRPADLLGEHGPELYAALTAARDQGRTAAIGISIYDAPAELDALCRRYEFNLIQAPFNIFDQRLLQSGWLEKLDRAGVEIHVRSVFLQGLLLMPPGKLPDRFAGWRPLWQRWRAWLYEAGLSPLQACLRFTLQQPAIDRVVIGVDGAAQFSEIFSAAFGLGSRLPDTGGLASYDEALINPTRW